MSEPLTADELAALPEGTPITVLWSGGNGPHRYLIHHDAHGVYAASVDGNPRLLTYNPLTFIGRERFHTQVRLAEPPS